MGCKAQSAANSMAIGKFCNAARPPDPGDEHGARTLRTVSQAQRAERNIGMPQYNHNQTVGHCRPRRRRQLKRCFAWGLALLISILLLILVLTPACLIFLVLFDYFWY